MLKEYKDQRPETMGQGSGVGSQESEPRVRGQGEMLKKEKSPITFAFVVLITLAFVP